MLGDFTWKCLVEHLSHNMGSINESSMHCSLFCTISKAKPPTSGRSRKMSNENNHPLAPFCLPQQTRQSTAGVRGLQLKNTMSEPNHSLCFARCKEESVSNQGRSAKFCSTAHTVRSYMAWGHYFCSFFLLKKCSVRPNVWNHVICLQSLVLERGRWGNKNLCFSNTQALIVIVPFCIFNWHSAECKRRCDIYNHIKTL